MSKPEVERLNTIVLSVTAMVSLVVVALVVGNEFVWDDIYFVEPLQRLGEDGGFSQLWHLMTRPFWESSSFLTHDLPTYWRPLTMFVLGLGGILFGDWAPGFHALSLLAAVGAAVSFALVVVRVLGSEQRVLSMWLALIFLIHPLCAEVLCLVANIADHLAMIFINVQLIALFDLQSRRLRWSRVALVGCSAFLACCAKEIGVVCAFGPVIAAMLLNARGSEAEKKTALKRPWPWIASLVPVIVYLALRSVVVAAADRETSLVDLTGLALEPVFIGPGLAVVTSLVPIPRGAHAFVPSMTWWALGVAVAFWLLSVGGVVQSIVKRRWPGLGVSGLTMALLLLTPSLLAVTFTEGAWRFPVRYFHLPLAGLLIAAAPFAQKIAGQLRLAMPIFVALLALLSFIRISEWHDERTFFVAEAEARPSSPFALSNLAVVLCESRAYDEAEAVADRFDALPEPRDEASEARIRLVRAKIDVLRDGDVEGATARLEQALRERPSDLTMLLTLTEIWAIAGHPEKSTSRVDRALESPHFRDHRRRVLEQYAQRYRDAAAIDNRQ